MSSSLAQGKSLPPPQKKTYTHTNTQKRRLDSARMYVLGSVPRTTHVPKTKTDAYLMGMEVLSHPAFGPAALHYPSWGAWCCSVEQGLGVPLLAGVPPGYAGFSASLEIL